MKRTLYLWLLAFWLVLPGLEAQDIHFSQFGYSTTNLNPGLTGIFRGSLRASANLRSQWKSADVDYLTFSSALDFKLPNNNPNRNGFFAAGLAFNYDQAGLANLQLTNINLNVSYTHKLSNKAFLSAGLQGGFSNRGFDLDPLSFNSQYDRSTSSFDPSRPANIDFPSYNNNFFDLGAGLNFRFQDFGTCEVVYDLSRRSYIDIGVGFFHVNQPDQSFDDIETVNLPIRYSPYIMANRQVDDFADVFAHANLQWQGSYKEWLAALGGRVYLDRSPDRPLSIALSCGYRFNNELGDVVYPGIELQVGRLYGSFTYDINLSDFRAATNRRGGPEFVLRYMINRICLNNYFCPLL